MSLTPGEIKHLLDAWMDSRGLVAQQIESYDDFIQRQLQSIVTENSSLTAENEKDRTRISLDFKKVSVRMPSIRESDGSSHLLTPHECRLRGLDYNVSVFVDILQTSLRSTPQGMESRRRLCSEILLCRLPCMVRSTCCATRLDPNCDPVSDQGGYFIVGGNEKSAIMQEKLRPNRTVVRRIDARTCSAEVRSLHATKVRSTSTLVVTLTARAGQRGEVMTVILPFVDTAVPAGAIFKLLGFSNIPSIMALLEPHLPRNVSGELLDLLARSLDTGLLLEERSSIVEYIGREGTREATATRRARYVEHILTNELLPHQGLDASEAVRRLKGAFLGTVVVKLARVFLGELPPDDRDDYSLKRVETTGGLLALLFRQLFRQLLKMLSVQASRALEANKPFAAGDALNSKKITHGIRYAMSTGSWGVQKQSSQHGVVQLLTRMNPLAALSQLRRVNTPVNRDGKQPQPRELSTTHYGLLCPVETPEGAACGLVENLSLLCHVRVGSDALHLVKLLTMLQQLRSPSAELCGRGWWSVCVNGCIVGFVEDGMLLCRQLRELRRAASLPMDTTVASCPAEQLVLLDTDSGCLVRPLLRREYIEQTRTLLRAVPPRRIWPELVSSGWVELIDKVEERCLLSLARAGAEAGHVELHPSLALGLVASLIPFCNHNQAPRNIYETSMAKQALSPPSRGAWERMDTVSHVLHYAQIPLVQTIVYSSTRCEDTAAGANAIVAILSYTGFNQEDSIILNRRALDSGFLRSSVYKCFRAEERRSATEHESFGLVRGDASGARRANYEKVQPDGTPALGALVESGDILVGKTAVQDHVMLSSTSKSGERPVDRSTVLSASEPMIVDRVLLTSNREGTRLLRVRLRALRVPAIGDKFSSHHGQKGVVGMILPEEDMPFTSSGLTPDIVVNPHGLPSRMTMAQLLEMLLGKVCALEGEIGDGTPFNGLSSDQIGEVLTKHGFHSRGEETMFNGSTGEPLKTTVFIGPCHFSRLRHCVVEKVHARSRGPVQMLTRQPVEGRSRGGGLRVGEMERDCILSHGASAVLLDRLFLQSDPFDCHVCRKCGTIAESMAPDAPVHVLSSEQCRGCRLSGKDHIASVTIPYNMKLLHQELAGLGVAMRFMVGDRSDTAQ
jgi:DNA-directed RNA polymerase II subunit RPB2